MQFYVERAPWAYFLPPLTPLNIPLGKKKFGFNVRIINKENQTRKRGKMEKKNMDFNILLITQFFVLFLGKHL